MCLDDGSKKKQLELTSFVQLQNCWKTIGQHNAEHLKENWHKYDHQSLPFLVLEERQWVHPKWKNLKACGDDDAHAGYYAQVGVDLTLVIFG